MSDDAVKDALVEMQTILDAVTITGGAVANTWIHPFDHASYTDFTEATATAPIIVVEQMTFERGEWLKLVSGRGVNSWKAMISLYLGKEFVTSVEETAAMDYVNIWIKALVDALLTNQSLNNTASIVGARSFPGPIIEDYWIGKLSHPKTEINHTKFFFGAVLITNIWQQHTQTMTA